MTSELNFDSLKAVAVHARRVRDGIELGMTRGLRSASSHLLREVHMMFGHYQDGEGPFESWAKLADSTLDRKKYWDFPGSDPGAPLLGLPTTKGGGFHISGTLRDSYQLAIEGNEAVIGSDLEYALVQEMGGWAGHSYIPPRSTLGIAFIRAEKSMFERYNRELEYVVVAIDTIQRLSR